MSAVVDIFRHLPSRKDRIRFSGPGIVKTDTNNGHLRFTAPMGLFIIDPRKECAYWFDGRDCMDPMFQSMYPCDKQGRFKCGVYGHFVTAYFVSFDQKDAVCEYVAREFEYVVEIYED